MEGEQRQGQSKTANKLNKMRIFILGILFREPVFLGSEPAT